MGATAQSERGTAPRTALTHAGLAAVVASLLLLGLLALSPRFTELSDYRVQPETVQVLPHDGIRPTRRKRAGEREYNLVSARQMPRDQGRQYLLLSTLERAPSEPEIVFVPMVGGSATLYMNGVRLAEDQGAGPHIAGLSNRYISAAIPLESYQPGINRLTIRLDPDRSAAGLPAIYRLDDPSYAERMPALTTLRASRTTRAEWAVIAGGTLLLIVAVVGLFLKSRTRIYIALGSIGACLLLQRVLAATALERSPAFELGAAGVLYLCLAGALLVLRGRGELQQRPILSGLWAAALLSVFASMLLLLPVAKPPLWNAFAMISLLGVLPGALAIGFAALGHDRTQYARIQQELARTITDQQDIIAAQQRAIEEGLMAKGRLEERQRLTRDIHDGIGGHLLSMLVRVRGGDMSELEIESDLEFGLNDLRLIVDSMDHSDQTLKAALVTFRARAAAQLRAAGITLVWNQSDALPDTLFGPAAILDIYRLLQEALTNAIRHAQCKRVEITITRQDDALLFEVADDGVGLPDGDAPRAGQGLRSMTYRARKLGGTLDISGAPGAGTTVCVTLPLTPDDGPGSS